MLMLFGHLFECRTRVAPHAIGKSFEQNIGSIICVVQTKSGGEKKTIRIVYNYLFEFS
jgi:hypothetical protein